MSDSASPTEAPRETRGTLTVVGTGIRSVGQATLETRGFIEKADKLLYLVADRVTEAWIRKLNPAAESLADCYVEGRPRIESYQEMVDRILSFLEDQRDVCAVFYGHPGVFVLPAHRAIRQARERGFEAQMLPGISAEDCLFADIGIDPGGCGCQSYEATDFLVQRRRFDPTSHLILWQIGVIGELSYQRSPDEDRVGVRYLERTLLDHYPADHEVVIYEAAQYPGCDPVMELVRLADLSSTELSSISTLYVAPLPTRRPDPEVMSALGMTGC